MLVRICSCTLSSILFKMHTLRTFLYRDCSIIDRSFMQGLFSQVFI